jgi:hypothetical protein
LFEPCAEVKNLAWANRTCVADVWRFSDVTQRHEVHLWARSFHAGPLSDVDVSSGPQAAD